MDIVAAEGIALCGPAHFVRLLREKRLDVYNEDSGMKALTATCMFTVMRVYAGGLDMSSITVMTFNAS